MGRRSATDPVLGLLDGATHYLDLVSARAEAMGRQGFLRRRRRRLVRRVRRLVRRGTRLAVAGTAAPAVAVAVAAGWAWARSR